MINFVPPQKYNYYAYKDKTIDQYNDICGRVNTVLEGTTYEAQQEDNLVSEAKEQLDAQKALEAKKEAKTAKIISIISVVTSILFSLASLIVAILK